jgi:TRAP-type mannitol/chloroaromatic compound transport system permease large subunit
VTLTETALISPPEGLNLYVIQAFRKAGPEGQAPGTIMDVWIGVMPFFLVYILGIALVMVFPQSAVWLPNTMRGS